MHIFIKTTKCTFISNAWFGFGTFMKDLHVKQSIKTRKYMDMCYVLPEPHPLPLPLPRPAAEHSSSLDLCKPLMSCSMTESVFAIYVTCNKNNYFKVNVAAFK